MNREEAIDRHKVSREDMDHAVNLLHSAITKLNSAALRAMHDQARLIDPDSRRSYLISEAAMNKSGWSGGPTNANNIIDAAKRAAALDLLLRPPPDIDPSLKE